MNTCIKCGEIILPEKGCECADKRASGSLQPDGSANALTMREKALRDIKAVHTRWYSRGEITAEQAVVEMEAIAVSVWQREHSPNAQAHGTAGGGNQPKTP